jgi:uncharacterized protein YceK
VKKLLFLLIVAQVVSGCASTVSTDVERLQPHSGKGALAFVTLFTTLNGSHTCKSVAIDMENPDLEKPVTLSFVPDEDKKFVLFDGLEPGTYTVNAVRCLPPSGYVFNGNKNYLEGKVTHDFIVEANTLILSPYAFYGDELPYNKFTFNYQGSADNIDLLKRLINGDQIYMWRINDYQ